MKPPPLPWMRKKQKVLAEKAREWLGKVIEANPKNYEARIKVAMTYLSSGGPMQGIKQLREVLKEDPKKWACIVYHGYAFPAISPNGKAVDWLKQLDEVNPRHVHGPTFAGRCLYERGQNAAARRQFEKVKKMDNDPAVQETVDSYLKDLK